MWPFKKRPYTENQLAAASFLIGSADCYAVAAQTSLEKEFEQMNSITDSGLDSVFQYVFKIACVGTAFMVIVDTVKESDVKGLSYAIQAELNARDTIGYEYMVNLLHYVRRLIDKNVRPDDAIGGWIWVNLEKDSHANDALRKLAASLILIRPTGAMVVSAYYNWWKDQAVKATP
jgi:hypothetical protein